MVRRTPIIKISNCFFFFCRKRRQRKDRARKESKNRSRMVRLTATKSSLHAGIIDIGIGLDILGGAPTPPGQSVWQAHQNNTSSNRWSCCGLYPSRTLLFPSSSVHKHTIPAAENRPMSGHFFCSHSFSHSFCIIYYVNIVALIFAAVW